MNKGNLRFRNRYIVLFVVLFLTVLALGLFDSEVSAVPIIHATKVDTLVVDSDGDNAADPGDTLRYTVVVAQYGSTDAGNVAFADVIDANTTLIPGSLRTTPIARHDQYASLGNVGISVPPSSGVLVNDNDPDGQSVSVIAAAGGTANGGAFAIGADGAFSYLPPAGFEGVDSFDYLIQDTDGNQDPATVFVVVTEMLWFINNAAGAPGGGGITTPFNSISAFNAIQTGSAPGAKDGDIVFLHSGSGNYTDGIALRNGQTLVGQGATPSIAAITGITVPPFSNVLPATGGARPTITNASGDGVLLGQNNLLRGFNIGNTAGVGISDNGGTVGTLTTSEIAISGTGGGVEADNGGALAITLDSLSASGSSDEGIDLENVSGSFTVVATNGTLNMTGLPAVVVDGNPSLALNLSLTSVSSSGAADGILIRDTTGSFAVAGSGSTDGSGGTISNITNRGASFTNASNISLSNMTFNNASTANGGTCTSLDNSGCNAAIHLDNTTTVNLTNVDISTSAQQGINGLNVNGFTLANSTVTACGGEVNEGCLRMVNLSGTASISNSDLSFPAERVAQIENTNVTLNLTVSSSTFRDSQSSGLGADTLELTSNGTANTTIDITNSSFLRYRTNGLQVLSEGNAIVSLDVTGSTFDVGADNADPAAYDDGIGMDLSANNNGQLNFNVVNNPLISSRGGPSVNSSAFVNSSVQGRINNNTITFEEDAPNFGGAIIGVDLKANDNSTSVFEVSGNTLTGTNAGYGIRAISRDVGGGRMDATINNNTVTNVGANGLYAIWVQASDGDTTCANVSNNATTPPPSGNAFYARESSGALLLQGFTIDATTTWNNNGNTPLNSVFESPAGSASGGTCNTVSHAMASAAPAGPALVDEPAQLQTDSWALNPAAWQRIVEQPLAASAPGPVAAAAGKDGHLAKPLQSGETINISLGTLNPGQVVYIVFDVTIDDPQIPVTNGQVCNQGVFSGGNFANVLTHDPSVASYPGVVFYPAPTCTPLAPGTIIIAKDQSPNGSSSFGFTSNIPGSATFNVNGDSSVTINNVPAGSYTVSEDDPSANFFQLNGLDCDDDTSAAPSTADTGTRTATINLEPGETVTCTFTNEQVAAIEVVKSVDVTPNGETFNLLIDGNVEASGVGDGGTTGAVPVALGGHTVSETGTNLSNYDTEIACVEQNSGSDLAFATGTSINTGPLFPGDDVLCTITNTHKRGNLEVAKALFPASDGGSFDLLIDGNVLATGGNGTSTGQQSVTVGTHLVSETGNATNLSNYTTGISCRDNNGIGSPVTATPNGAYGWDVMVNEGDDIVCTIINERKGTINIVKEAIPAGDTVFSFSQGVNDSGNFTLQDPSDDTETFANIPAASLYTVSEISIPTGWDLTDITCAEDQVANSTDDETSGQASIMLDPGETVTCTFTNEFNRAPVANDDSYSTNEDTTLNEATVGPLGDGVLANDTDADGDSLTAALDSNPGHGTLTLNDDGSFSYTPATNYCGPDSFTYHANDGLADSNVATVSIDVICVDDPPVVSVGTASQSVQYSDYITDVTVTATDVDSHPLTIGDDAPFNLSTSGGCTAAGDGTSCSWTLSGQVLVSAGSYDVTFIVSDASSDVTAQTEVIVLAEDATVKFDDNNPVAVEVDGEGSDSSEPFTLLVQVQEKAESGADVAPGDINLAEVSVTLEPVGPGSPASVNCTSTGPVAQFDYSAVLEVACDFSGVPVNTYTVVASVGGGYYTGAGEDVLTIYDPSLGFTTGGGWFYWPGSEDAASGYPGDRTNFGYTMKYNKKATNVQGSLLVIRHLPDGSIYRLKSNAVDGLALGDGDNSSYGWATFSGKATYLGAGMSEAEGNHTFIAYVEDHGQPGAGIDKFWIDVQDKDGAVADELSMDAPADVNAETIEGGNIVVPHEPKGNGRRNLIE